MGEEANQRLPCEQALAFGPVPSRRLGISVGVNVVPRKVCSYNCVYCQLGRTTKLTLDRAAYTPTGEIVSAVLEKLGLAPHTDYVTVIGDGEPTLAANLDEVRARVSEAWPGKTALLTNGSLFWMGDVRSAAAGFDAVLPTVSAGDEKTFRRLHRPHGSLSFDKCVGGLKTFCSEHADKTWAEVMLVKDINDTPESLRAIGALVEELSPAEVHLTAPIRPPSVSSVQPPARESIDLALREIPGSVDFTHPETSDMPASKASPGQHLVEITGTHPLRRSQAMDVLMNAGLSESGAAEALASLVESGSLVPLERQGDRFYVRGRPRPARNTFK
ncbi:MAG: radical SAM protein [Thermoplasmata archaeon]